MKRIETRLSAPLIGMALLTVVALVVTLFLLAARVDDAAQRHEEALVARGMQTRAADIERSISPQITWDDAVEHLDNRFDPDWARDNIGAYLLNQGGFDMIFIVDQSDRPVFARTVDAETAPDWYARHVGTFAPVVGKLRAAESRLVRPTGPGPGGGMVSRPVQTSAVGEIDGVIFLITASLVQPDFGKALIKHPRAPVVITVQKLDAMFLENLANRFLLTGVHLHSATPRMTRATPTCRCVTFRAASSLRSTGSPPIPVNGCCARRCCRSCWWLAA